MIINNETTLEDFILYTDAFKVGDKKKKGLFDELEKLGRPQMILEKQTPEDLDGLTLKELINLQNARTLQDMVFVSAEAILGISKEELLKAKAFDVLRFMFFVMSELERIADMFDKIKYKPSKVEIEAGIKSIDNGIFGMIDWYARRMGFVNHDFCAKTTKWIIVYQCMKIDNTSAEYEKNLHKILTKKKK